MPMASVLCGIERMPFLTLERGLRDRTVVHALQLDSPFREAVSKRQEMDVVLLVCGGRFCQQQQHQSDTRK